MGLSAQDRFSSAPCSSREQLRVKTEGRNARQTIPVGIGAFAVASNANHRCLCRREEGIYRTNLRAALNVIIYHEHQVTLLTVSCGGREFLSDQNSRQNFANHSLPGPLAPTL